MLIMISKLLINKIITKDFVFTRTVYFASSATTGAVGAGAGGPRMGDPVAALIVFQSAQHIGVHIQLKAIVKPKILHKQGNLSSSILPLFKSTKTDRESRQHT